MTAGSPEKPSFSFDVIPECLYRESAIKLFYDELQIPDKDIRG